MGADLIGYWAHVPVRKYKSVMRLHFRGLWKVLKHDAKNDTEACAMLRFLDEAGVEIAEYADSGEEALQILERIRDDVTLAKEFVLGRGYRDMSSSGLMVNGCEVEVCFAGDMSWGDSPNGAGYLMLEAVYKTGLEDAFYAAIPWGKTTKKFRPRAKAFFTLRLKMP